MKGTIYKKKSSKIHQNMVSSTEQNDLNKEENRSSANREDIIMHVNNSITFMLYD